MFLTLMMSSLSVLKSICLLISCKRTLYQVLGSENAFLCFFLDCFLLKVWLMFIHMIHFELISVSGGDLGQGFIFGLWLSNCIICWIDYSSSIKLILHLLFFFFFKKGCWLHLCCTISEFSYFIAMTYLCLSLCQYHILYYCSCII